MVGDEGGIWKNEAVGNIKAYLIQAINKMPDDIKDKITVIG